MGRASDLWKKKNKGLISRYPSHLHCEEIQIFCWESYPCASLGQILCSVFYYSLLLVSRHLESQERKKEMLTYFLFL